MKLNYGKETYICEFPFLRTFPHSIGTHPGFFLARTFLHSIGTHPGFLLEKIFGGDTFKNSGRHPPLKKEGIFSLGGGGGQILRIVDTDINYCSKLCSNPVNDRHFLLGKGTV